MLKKVYMFVNVDWFFFSHRAVIAENAQKYGVEMSVFTEITNAEHKRNGAYKLIKSPLKRVSAHKILLIKEIWQVYKILKASRPDLLHAVTVKPIIIIGLIARITKTPFIGAISGLGPAFSHERLKSRIYRLALTKILKIILSPDRVRVICQNKNDKEMLIDLGVIDEDKVHIFPGSGVNLIRFRPSNRRVQKNDFVLMAARLLKDKGIEDYCNAAEQLRERYDIEFKLAGVFDESSPTHLTKENVQKLCLKTGVEFLGPRDDMHQLLRNAMVFVYPSYYAEGLPKVLQEAAASGTPVLTSNHPGCRDAVVDGYNGFLFEPTNVHDLIDKFHTLMNSDIPRLGRNARSLAVRKFDDEYIVQCHYDIYQKVLVKDFD